MPTTISGASGVDKIVDGTVSFTDMVGSEWENSKAQNGYTKLPNGLIMQWGEFSSNADNNLKVFFAIPFPTACVGVTSFGTSSNQTGMMAWTADAITNESFDADRDDGIDITFTAKYFAIGY